ncbi:hypothetical protein BDZ97DRAFT_1397772 [Flammula alnicola]|nr:hypothetical protein BDZ97DRAFT_1397772 [Flammula alnicola]
MHANHFFPWPRTPRIRLMKVQSHRDVKDYIVCFDLLACSVESLCPSLSSLLTHRTHVRHQHIFASTNPRETSGLRLSSESYHYRDKLCTADRRSSEQHTPVRVSRRYMRKRYLETGREGWMEPVRLRCMRLVDEGIELLRCEKLASYSPFLPGYRQ